MQRAISFSSVLPPGEIVPLLSEKGYWYARGYGGLFHIRKSTHSHFDGGFASYWCISKNCGLWALIEKKHHSSHREIITFSYSYSYIDHPYLDFFDTNIRIGMTSNVQSNQKLFVHFSQACGAYYWLDCGWYATTVTSFSSFQEATLGVYAKADHLADHLSLQIGTERIFVKNTRSTQALYALVEYDGSRYDTSIAPLMQWWCRWYLNKNIHAREWNISIGMNGCWTY